MFDHFVNIISERLYVLVICNIDFLTFMYLFTLSMVTSDYGDLSNSIVLCKIITAGVFSVFQTLKLYYFVILEGVNVLMYTVFIRNRSKSTHTVHLCNRWVFIKLFV